MQPLTQSILLTFPPTKVQPTISITGESLCSNRPDNLDAMLAAQSTYLKPLAGRSSIVVKISIRKLLINLQLRTQFTLFSPLLAKALPIRSITGEMPWFISTNPSKQRRNMQQHMQSALPTPHGKIAVKILNRWGNILFGRGNYSEAVEKYVAAYAICSVQFPTAKVAAKILNKWGNALLCMGNHPKAVKKFAKRLTPSSPGTSQTAKLLATICNPGHLLLMLWERARKL